MSDGSLRRTSMREVARLAGVSVSTVANVLNRPRVVAEETRRRVEDAMVGLGYVRSGPARQLRGLPSPLVGSITLDVANPFYAELNRGIEDRLAEDGCLLLACSTDLNGTKEKRLLTLLEEQGVRGVIITPVDEDPSALVEIARRGTPVVLLDHPRGELDLCSVSVDSRTGGALAAEHLIGLGHRRLAFVRGTVKARPVLERRAGVRDALAAAGLDPGRALLDVELTVQPPPLVEAANAAVAAILADPDPPTGIICINDSAALGVLGGLEQAGLRVPADISVVGYDDLPFASRLAPPLTTVDQPKYQMGQAAADLLLDESRRDGSGRGHTHREIRFSPSLVVRSSTAAPPAQP